MISVSVSYDFGRTRRENHRSQVEELLQEAFEQFEQHEYEHTLELVDKVLTIDPGNRRAEALKELVENQQELEKQAGKVNGGSAR
jgi:Tfp pilus assembly protein PilF